jgi:hypothetical protein
MSLLDSKHVYRTLECSSTETQKVTESWRWILPQLNDWLVVLQSLKSREKIRQRLGAQGKSEEEIQAEERLKNVRREIAEAAGRAKEVTVSWYESVAEILDRIEADKSVSRTALGFRKYVVRFFKKDDHIVDRANEMKRILYRLADSLLSLEPSSESSPPQPLSVFSGYDGRCRDMTTTTAQILDLNLFRFELEGAIQGFEKIAHEIEMANPPPSSMGQSDTQKK